jgi:nitrite reductase/ring-hydroxylating ferredoxin subunit
MAKWVEVAASQELGVGTRKCVTADGRPVVVCNVEGRLFAFQNVCPHAGLPLGEGELAGKVIICPFHGYAYDIESGRNVDFDGDVPLPRFPVRCEDGRIEVDLEPIPEGQPAEKK